MRKKLDEPPRGLPGLRTLRLACRWSREDLARLVNVRAGTIYRLEKGLADPSMALVRALVRVLKTDEHTLITVQVREDEEEEGE